MSARDKIFKNWKMINGEKKNKVNNFRKLKKNYK
jgi:hypothetical protein